jgi:squalene-hopene/tetraprenyl-beta-curcumene cyclase
VQEDGSIHHPKSGFHNYETSISVLAFQKANREGKYDKIIKNAEKFIRGGQFDEADGKKDSDVEYGGFGYGGDRQPDLSNTQVALDALKALGAGDDDPAVKKALAFVSRCQNLESAHNTTKFAAKINDGGFYYAPFEESGAAGGTPDGGLRSYGTMTYAGLKSMIYAGVDVDDERVKAAAEWIGKNYAVDSNPGMGDNGLFYYYHTFAKALAVMDLDAVKDAKGESHDWRADLVAELARRQQENGGWVNTNTRWLEGDQNLVTSYCLLALKFCQE